MVLLLPLMDVATNKENKTMFYFWRNTKQPTPGALSYAFLGRRLPEVYVVGPGQAVIRSMQAFQQPQNYTYQQLPIAGLGGLIHGSINGQGLSQSAIPLPGK